MIWVGAIAAEHAVTVISDYVIAFFDEYLKDIDTTFLDEASPDYPEVTFLQSGT